MGSRYFKLEEAQKLLPFIGPHLEKARQEKQKIETLDEDLARAAARITMLGGSQPNYVELVRKKTERDQGATRLQELVEGIHATGCVIKDLDVGLVDFPAIVQGEEAFLCWKLGEERIAYWHGLEEGFAGRRPIEEPPSGSPPAGRSRVQ